MGPHRQPLAVTTHAWVRATAASVKPNSFGGRKVTGASWVGLQAKACGRRVENRALTMVKTARADLPGGGPGRPTLHARLLLRAGSG
jgi:hypothetical protein